MSFEDMQKQTREMLLRKIPPEKLKEINAFSGLNIAEGATFLEAMNESIKEKARSGDKEAAAIVDNYGIK